MMQRPSRPRRVAIIGSGPAGFFAAQALLAQESVSISIDLFESLPTPYGLVRYGVAPDHAKIKAVSKVYQRIGMDPRVRFLGNVTFGQDISRGELKEHYDAIIYAVGAASDRHLNIAGEGLTNSLSATEFVAWYNGHPRYADLNVDLSGHSVAVIGMGNVAADVARILAKPVDDLAKTDIADHALEQLSQSQIKDIYLVGRRGPAQAKFTPKELREFGEIDTCDIIIDSQHLNLDEASLAFVKQDVTARTNMQIFESFEKRVSRKAPRRLHFKFLASPVKLLGATQVEALRLECNALEQTSSGYINAVGTGETFELAAHLVLRSVGYRGVALPDVPFDQRKGIIPNQAGRMLSMPEGEVVAGEYVAGWIKRGPLGVIGTNKADALETVQQILADFEQQAWVSDAAAQPEAISRLLHSRAVRSVSFADWLELDRHEMDLGKTQGRPRIKLSSVERMMQVFDRKAVLR